MSERLTDVASISPSDRWKRGNTYMGRHDGLVHLHVVLTDPEPTTGEVVVAVVSIETYRSSRYDDSCILNSSDGHPFLRNISYVNYQRSRIASISELAIELERFTRPMPDAAMDKIYRGAKRTHALPKEVRTILIRQGLIEY